MPEPLELLVLAKDKAGCKAGTVIEVRRSPAVWGSHESIREWVRQGYSPQDYPGNYRVVKTSALSWEEARRLLEPDIQLVSTPSIENPDVLEQQPMAVRIRKTFIDIVNLPPEIRADVETDDGRDAVSLAQRAVFLNSIKDGGNPTKVVDITKELPKVALPTRGLGQ